MADKARKWTDAELAQMERRIEQIYKQSQKEITKKWNAYMNKVAEKLDALQKQYDEAKKAGDTERARILGAKLGQAKASETFQNKRYREMLNYTTEQLANVNQVAVAYLNGEMPLIYAVNYNQVVQGENQVDVSFGLIDEATVNRMIADGDIVLPKKKVIIPKDMRWNKKQLNSAVLQGILQGESMKKIAERILPIVGNNKNAAIRNARTMVTGAENRGRFDRSTELEALGAVIEKRWIATPDNRTRDSHMALDGETRRKEQRFSNGLMFPGDPSGRPEEVYNCRCSMSTQIVGFVKDDGSVVMWGSTSTTTALHERQMANERARRAAQ